MHAVRDRIPMQDPPILFPCHTLRFEGREIQKRCGTEDPPSLRLRPLTFLTPWVPLQLREGSRMGAVLATMASLVSLHW